jgi:hypothetical protein
VADRPAGDPAAQETAVLAARQRAQLLSGPPAADPLAVAEQLLALQAQDPRGVRLAVRARTRGGTVEAFDRALTVERSLVISWLCRCTLHLVRVEDLAWLHELSAPALLTATARRLGQLGVGTAQAQRGVAAIERALADNGPLTRAQLRAQLDLAGIPTAGQILVHLLGQASARGLIVRGPMVGAAQAFVLVRDWLGRQSSIDRDHALAELAGRFLRGHGPAGDRDLAKWAGLPLRDARRGLTAIASRLRTRPDGLLELAGQRSVRAPAAPRLLGAFDPLLMGWASREPVLGRHADRVVSGGVFRPIALVEGRAAGVWAWRAGAVEVEPFGPLAPPVAAALQAEARDVARYLSRPR